MVHVHVRALQLQGGRLGAFGMSPCWRRGALRRVFAARARRTVLGLVIAAKPIESASGSNFAATIAAPVTAPEVLG